MSDIDPTTGRKTANDPRQHFRMAAQSFTRPGKLEPIVDPVERMVTKGLHVASIDWCTENGTDGHVVPEHLCELLGLPVLFGKNLIAYGMWHQADHNCRRCPQPRRGHVYVHDYLSHNRTAAQEADLAEKRRRAAAASHESRRANRQPVAAFEAPRRGPGRPRKHPLPEPAAAGQAVVHPAEVKAKNRSGARPVIAPQEFQPIVHELCELLADRVRQNGYGVPRKLGANTWLNPCRLLLERGFPHSEEGPLTAEQVRNAILWATDDDFHSKNVRSMASLRKKYDVLRSDARDAGRPRRSQGGVRRFTAAPAALPVTGMAAMLARQMGSSQGGLVKGA